MSIDQKLQNFDNKLKKAFSNLGKNAKIVVVTTVIGIASLGLLMGSYQLGANEARNRAEQNAEQKIEEITSNHYNTIENLMDQYNAGIENAKIDKGWSAPDLDKDGLGPDPIVMTKGGEMYVLYANGTGEFVIRPADSYFSDAGKFMERFNVMPIEYDMNVPIDPRNPTP